MPRVILMGPPGSGKGTQGEILANDWGVPRISPGDIFRAEIKHGSELGQKVQSYSDSGRLVPDEIVIEVMRNRLCQPDAEDGWLLDGFPRTVPQAQALNQMLAEISQKYDCIINLDVPEENLLKRLHARATEQGRVDDNEEVIKSRLEEYYSKTQPLLEFYGEHVINIDGSPLMSEVTEDIKNKLALA